jgi:hypothetical protein
MALSISAVQTVKPSAAVTANVSALKRALLSATTRAEVEKIHPNVMASLTAGQVAALSTTQQSYLTGAQLSKLSAAAWDGMKSTAVALFSDEQVRALGKNFMSGGSYGFLSALPADKLSQLSPEAVRSIQAKNIWRLSGEQLNALLSNAQGSTAGSPSNLSAEAVSGITSINILGVSADGVRALSPGAISSLPVGLLEHAVQPP